MIKLSTELRSNIVKLGERMVDNKINGRAQSVFIYYEIPVPKELE